MAEPLKELINRPALRRLADELAATGPGFARDRFLRRAKRGLEELELKDRVRHVARCLRDCLDSDYEAALAHVIASLPPPLEGEDALTSNFVYWPYCHFVEEFALEELGEDGSPRHFDSSMAALYELTQRFSAEFAIRPFLAQHPERTLRLLEKWSQDPSSHVRRLCSEGTRPYLPWGKRLDTFVADPTPVLPLLERLKEDRSLYVRRSVANHVNDIARHAPELTLEICSRWQSLGSEEVRWVVKQALRTLIKQGSPEALAILGYGKADVRTDLRISPAQTDIGGSVRLNLRLANHRAEPQRLLIDYTVHFVKANGGTRPKVFKWKELEIEPGETLELAKTQAFKQVTTRRHYPGEHRIEVLINGRAATTALVMLTPSCSTQAPP